MRLKEIKPGMVIHCKTEDEIRTLLQEAKSLGYTWASGQAINPEKDLFETICFYNAYIAWAERRDDEIEFSDLILPELTAEEVLSTISEMCRNKSCKECYLGSFCDRTNSACSIQLMEPSVVIDACIKWKSDHSKKEPEIETVDICRIIEIQQDGRKRCVHEETIEKPITLEVEETLKRYCMEHEGEFIAVHEVVSRVKRWST